MKSKNKYFWIGIFLLGLSFSYAQKKKLTTEQITAFKSGLKAKSSEIASLQSDFAQIKHLDFMENDIKSSGKLYFKASATVRWEYTSPYSYYLIFKNDKMFINDGGKKQEVNASAKMLKELNKIIAGTAQGANLFDETRFNISYFRDNEFYYAELKPKDKSISKYIRQIDLKIGAESYLVNEVKIIEPSLDYTQISFKNQKTNSNIPNEKFNFN